jgi:CubicO group peptidase (beta-lactamase class C family)
MIRFVGLSFLLTALALSGALAITQQQAGGDWLKGPALDAGISEMKLRGMEAAIKSGEFKKIGSVLIARHGKLVYEAYFDGDASTLRDTRSATKSITDTLVGIAIREGRLTGVGTRVLSVLTEHAARIQNPDPRKLEITVEDFLTMSSPLECDDWNDLSRGNEEKMYLVEDWTQFVLDLPIRGRMRVGDQVAPLPYGRNFSYCTGGVFTLSEVLQKQTGMRVDRYAEQMLFTPLGIAQAVWVYSPLSIPQTGGGLRLTSRDLLKIPQLYLNGGDWNGSTIVDAAWVKDSIRPHARIDVDTDYGYLWWLKSFKVDGKSYPAFYMNGNGGNKVLGIPSLDMAVAVTSTNYNTRGMHEQTERLLVDFVLAAIQG